MTDDLAIYNPKHPVKYRSPLSGGDIPHISKADVEYMIDTARQHPRHGERDSLLVMTLFDGALRCSEALRIRPVDITENDSGFFIQNVNGKGYKGQSRIRNAAISQSLASKLFSYAYQNGIGKTDQFFKINRSRAHQIISALMTEAGIQKPEHVGAVHVLRHSGALERLAMTGNPKALQDQLGHANAEMTIRYMKTLSKAETLKIQQGVDFKW
jgi:integrase